MFIHVREHMLQLLIEPFSTAPLMQRWCVAKLSLSLLPCFKPNYDTVAGVGASIHVGCVHVGTIFFL